MDLHNLAPNEGSRSNRKRLGRGNSSGWGRTGGRGEKGQKARSGGKVRPGFEGGQMPLYRRIPKFGFRPLKAIRGENAYLVLNLDILDQFENGSEVSPETLAAHGISPRSKQKAGIKVIASGSLDKKLTVRLHKISAGARAAIEAKGGTVEVLSASSEASAE